MLLSMIVECKSVIENNMFYKKFVNIRHKKMCIFFKKLGYIHFHA